MPDIELNPATLFFAAALVVAGIGFLASVTIPGFIGAGAGEAPAGEQEPETVGAHEAHPSPAEYIQIAVVLAVVTAIEVALYYIDVSDGLLVPLLLGFSFIKFVLVALWYMHLKFDSRLFSGMFAAGIAMAVTVYTVVLFTFRVFA